MIKYHCALGQILETANNTIEDEESWEVVENSKDFVQAYIGYCINDYVDKYAYAGTFSNWWDNVKMGYHEIHGVEQIDKMSSNHTYDKELIGVIDGGIYNTLDVLSFIPGIDAVSYTHLTLPTSDLV